MLKRYTSRFPHALRGITYAAQKDFGFRTQIYGIGLTITIIIYLIAPLTSTELLFICLAYVMILITELQNSALEIALDRLHPELHNAIGKSKDMAAGAVLIAGFFLAVVLTSLIYARSEVLQDLLWFILK